jgi:hypothetical protein
MARQQAKRKLVERPGLLAAAAALGCNYSHLRRVVIGDRQSESLMARYREFKRQPANVSTKPPPKPMRVALPVDGAALQNMSAQFISMIQKLGFEIVLVCFRVSPAPSIYPCPNETPLKLDEALRAVKAGHFDASSFPLGYHLHWFHVKKNRLGLAIATLKSTLEEPDFLPITTIFHVQAPGEFYQWFGADPATLINTYAEHDDE